MRDCWSSVFSKTALQEVNNSLSVSTALSVDVYIGTYVSITGGSMDNFVILGFPESAYLVFTNGYNIS